MISKHFAVFLVSTEALITNITIQNQLVAPKKIRKSPKQFLRFMLITINDLVLIRLLMSCSVIMALTSVSGECTD